MHVVNSEKQAGGQPRASTASLALLSEAAVLKRACDRDVAAFEELVRRTERELYRVAMRYVHIESDAQDILQNAYLSAWRGLPSFEGRAQFRSWMYRITVNESLMVLRARSRHREASLDEVESTKLDVAVNKPAHGSVLREDESHRPDHRLQSAELRGRIAIAVSFLPPKLRETFLLRDVGEMSTKDAASKLGVSMPAAKTRLFRARRALKESLTNYVAC
jgi:RNA polymerase sigma-70 factor (ECF subfamily)